MQLQRCLSPSCFSCLLLLLTYMHWSGAAPLFQLHPPADKKPNPRQSCCSASVPNSSKLCDVSILQQHTHTHTQVSDASQLEQQDLMMFWLAWPPFLDATGIQRVSVNPQDTISWVFLALLSVSRAKLDILKKIILLPDWLFGWDVIHSLKKGPGDREATKKITFLTSEVFHKTSEHSLL